MSQLMLSHSFHMSNTWNIVNITKITKASLGFASLNRMKLYLRFHQGQVPRYIWLFHCETTFRVNVKIIAAAWNSEILLLIAGHYHVTCVAQALGLSCKTTRVQIYHRYGKWNRKKLADGRFFKSIFEIVFQDSVRMIKLLHNRHRFIKYNLLSAYPTPKLTGVTTDCCTVNKKKAMIFFPNFCMRFSNL